MTDYIFVALLLPLGSTETHSDFDLWWWSFGIAVRVVDNTLTIIIASAVGGAIALIMGFMLLKNFTLFVMSKLEEKKYVLPATPVICLLYTVFQEYMNNADLHISGNSYRENIFLIAKLLTPSLFHFYSKECLVTSSGIDNTENGLSGSKADSKATPKKKWKKGDARMFKRNG